MRLVTTDLNEPTTVEMVWAMGLPSSRISVRGITGYEHGTG